MSERATGRAGPPGAGDGQPIASGVLGELFWATIEPVIVLADERPAAWNPAAAAAFAISAEEALAPGFDLGRVFGPALPDLLRVARDGGQIAALDCGAAAGGMLAVTSWRLRDGTSVVVLRDVERERRQLERLRTLNAVGRALLSERSFDALLQRIVDEARGLTGAAFSALLILREDSISEVAHFAYNAPRELFPERLPRAVGLLAHVLRSRAPARLAEIRNHPAGVGIPVEHPPIQALLAVPVLAGERVLGELAVANQPGGGVFTEGDEAVLTELAAHASLAVALAAARADKTAAEERRRALMDAARHDVRSPIATAVGYLDLLRDEGAAMGEDERQRVLGVIDGALRRVRKLADRLVLDDQLEEDGLQPRTQPVSPAELLDLVQRDLWLEADARAVAISVRAESDCPERFRADPALARQVLENLVGNAIKHSPHGGSVWATARAEGDSVRFDVTDRGAGIPPDEQDRLFQRWFRTPQSVAARVPGTGLGLSLVRRVAEAHGGGVGLASRPGQGSTFWVTFPVGGPGMSPPQDA